MKRRLLASAAVLLITLAACNQSQIDPEADVSIAGTVERQDGAPVSGARVALMREASASDVFFGVVSVGLTCLEQELSECGEQRVETSGDDGGFAYELSGRDVQTRFGNASIMELATVLPRADEELAGPGVNTRFQVQAEEARVPLRAWEPALDLQGTGRNVRLSWTQPPADVFPPAADLGDLTHRVLFDTADDEPVWEASSGPDAFEVDARVLEDTRGGVVVFAEVDDIPAPPEAGTDVEVLVRSGKLPYVSPAGAPPSRGKPCLATAAGGDLVQQPSCGLTDGDLDTPFVPDTCPPGDEACREPGDSALVVDLEEAMDVTFVVLRGCAGTCTVEASEDGSAWGPVGTTGGEDLGPRDAVVTPEGGARGRFVRISGELQSLREVSVWDDRPVDAQGSLAVAPSDVTAGPLPDRSGDGSGWLLPFIAGLLVLGAIVVVIVLTRRRAT